MTSLLQTPNQKEVLHDLDSSRVESQSDDDSDVNHNGERATHAPKLKQKQKQKATEDHEATYTEEAHTNYSLFSNPPDLGHVRQQLFDVKDEIEMSAKDFEEYFPFVDNVWRKTRVGEVQNDAGGTTETFCCRLKPSGQAKTATPRPHIEGKQQRKKRKREEKTCAVLMKVTYVESPVKKVKITRASGPAESHSHDLEYMDMNKRNSAIMDVARREAIRGFLPGSIYWKMQEEPDKMDEAGGKHMKVSDVRNVQYPWRQQNMTATLKAHAGYSQHRSGPRNRSGRGSAPATPTNNGNVKPHVTPQVFAPNPPRPPPRAAQPPPPPPPPLLPPGTLNYPELAKEFLLPYLPYGPRIASQNRPHITMTWASSLDSRIALQPGVQTAISGLETKAMTHFLRSQHDAILIGVKTAIADNPGLNCRLAGAGGYGGQNGIMQPRPIIIDPRGRLVIDPKMRLLQAASEGKALGPWIVVGPGVHLHDNAIKTLKAHGGEFLQVGEIHPQHGLDWESLFQVLYKEGIQSIMIEGGGKVLSELLKPRYTHIIDSVIITIAPTFFGKNGVEVSPDTSYDGQQPIQTRLVQVKWQPMGSSDVVLCAHMDQARLPLPSQPTQPHQPQLPGIHEFSRQAGPSSHGPPHQSNHANPHGPVPPTPLPPQRSPQGLSQQPHTNGTTSSAARQH